MNTSDNQSQNSPTATIQNPHLKKVLKAYQAQAMNNLNGPSSAHSWTDTVSSTSSSAKRSSSVLSVITSTIKTAKKSSHDGQDRPETAFQLPFPIQPAPVLYAADQASAERKEVILEGQTISCFEVGGEKRLVLPQLLNTVWTDRPLEEINQVCDDLHVFIAQCTQQQLECLKNNKILPAGAPSCGLITQTDAERLCGRILQHEEASFPIAHRDKLLQIPVIHREFGKVVGTCFPELYSREESPCIECRECRALLSPRHFVLHSHRSMEERRLCHWGFDSNNWRHYILIQDDLSQEAQRQLLPLLEDFRKKHRNGGNDKQTSQSRRLCKGSLIEEEANRLSALANGKRIKIEEAVYPGHAGFPAMWFIPRDNEKLATGYVASPADMASTFTRAVVSVNNLTVVSSANQSAIPAYLNKGPPMMMNPDKIVLQSPFDKFAHGEKLPPNVALVPAPRSVVSMSSQSSLPARSDGQHMSNPSSSRIVLSSNFNHAAADRQRGADFHEAADMIIETDDESSSESTLSIDEGREKPFLEEQEEELYRVLSQVDSGVKRQVLDVYSVTKQHYIKQLEDSRLENYRLKMKLELGEASRTESS
ncbi:hypothetical protein RvY_11569 [Ramazzottius varieornatus]|uniref:c-SKI SMAD4-binding domain-containing protein n=1 Tax=Ramazzottius varieornatus TaxID=947166 RepID=A0A1D1VLY6_RAMVA|nr:hypothetical protein RvY_11569 [Ramazzottius varieornatus]